jgi:hypothetical protein
MTTIAVPERYEFDGTDLSTFAYLAMKIDGADDMPPLRGENLVIPSRYGRFPTGKLHDQRDFAIAFFVSSSDAAGVVGGAAQARTNLDALLGLFAKRGFRTLTRHLANGTTRTSTAEVASVDQVADPSKGAGEAYTLLVTFRLADPYWYGTTIVDAARAIPASPTAFTITHPGSVRGHGILFDFVGPIANPKIVNAANAWELEILVTVASTKHLLVDCDLEVASNDGLNAIGSVRHSGGFDFMVFEPGANLLTVTATSPGGNLTTTFRPPYI